MQPAQGAQRLPPQRQPPYPAYLPYSQGMYCCAIDLVAITAMGVAQRQHAHVIVLRHFAYQIQLDRNRPVLLVTAKAGEENSDVHCFIAQDKIYFSVPSVSL